MPTAHLEPIDWVIIASWFVALLLIGLYYRRFAGRRLDHFFLGGRRNSGWANGLSYAAAMLNADVAPAYSGLTVATGLFICWWYLSRFGIAFFLRQGKGTQLVSLDAVVSILFRAHIFPRQFLGQPTGDSCLATGRRPAGTCHVLTDSFFRLLLPVTKEQLPPPPPAWDIPSTGPAGASRTRGAGVC
jgi:hypothetical protein